MNMPFENEYSVALKIFTQTAKLNKSKQINTGLEAFKGGRVIPGMYCDPFLQELT